jgi:hypothetical protein
MLYEPKEEKPNKTCRFRCFWESFGSSSNSNSTGGAVLLMELEPF